MRVSSITRRRFLRRSLGLGAVVLGGAVLVGDATALARVWQPRALTVPDRSGVSALLAPMSVPGGGADSSRPPIVFVHGNSSASSL